MLDLFYTGIILITSIKMNSKNYKQIAYLEFLVHKSSFTLVKIPWLKLILTEKQIQLTVKRLAHQVLENHLNLENTVLIGIQPRGIFLSDRIVNELKNLVSTDKILYGKLDITFYRDDLRREIKVPNKTDIKFSIENKKVVLIDDVLYTGRTIRATWT